MATHRLDVESLDFTEISPRDLAQLIKDLPKGALAAIAAGPSRGRIVNEMLSRMATSFNPEVGARLAALIRWRIADAGQPEIVFEMDIANRACRVTTGTSEREPRLVLTMSTADFARFVSGNATGPALFMAGRLGVTGELGLATGLVRYFDIPRV